MTPKKFRKTYASGKFELPLFYSVAPFNSLIERDKAQKVNENPGPGTYAAEKVKVVVTSQDKETNAFTTKIERFCPTYAGSTVFKPPTYI
jgi:hypothetical protein